MLIVQSRLKKIRIGLVAALGLVISILAGQFIEAPAAKADETGSHFVSVTPVRFVDTSIGTGGSTSPLGAAATRSYTVPGLPSNATAVLLDVAATSATVDSSLRIWPFGESMPSGTSVLAIESTQLPDSNSVIVPLGTNGKISVWNGNGSVDFNLDLHGYFLPSDGTAGFHALTAERIVDSPAGLGVTGPTITAGTTYDVQITGDTVPEGTTAIFANVKVSSATVEGGLRVAQGGASLSGLPSALNFDAGVTTDSGITIPLSSSGKLRLASTAASGTVKIYIDVQGYFAPGAGAEFHAGSQQVLVDNLTIAGGSDATVTAAGQAGLPSDGSVGSLALTVFVSTWTASGGVSVADPDDGPSALSNVSFTTSMDAGVGANSTAVVPLSEQGKLVVSNKSVNSVKLRLTVQGWFDNPDGAEGLVTPPTATAYPGIDSYQLEDLTYIADKEGISVETAIDRYGWQREFAEDVEQIQAENPNTFSSAELDPAGTGGAVIRFKGDAPNNLDTVLGGLPPQADVEVEESAPYTAAEMDAVGDVAAAAVRTELGESDDLATTRVDEKSGDVLTEVSNPDDAIQTDVEDLQESIEDALNEDLPSLDTPDVEVQSSGVAPFAATLRGGAAISTLKDWTDPDGTFCTSGFPVRMRLNDEDTGLITASHCPNVLPYYARRKHLNNASVWLDLTKGDIQYQRKKGEGVGHSFYYDKDGDDPAKLRVLGGLMPLTTGLKVCAFGRKSGRKICGTVAAEIKEQVYNVAGAIWVINGLWDVRMYDGDRVQKGDSGGPVYNDKYAVGLVSGGRGKKSGDPYAHMYMSPVREIINMGLELNLP